MGRIIKVLQTIKSFLRKHQYAWGLPIVCLGVLLLAVFYILNLTNHNLLFLPTLLILIGICGYVRQEKQHDKY
jgi:hypothetical protein